VVLVVVSMELLMLICNDVDSFVVFLSHCHPGSGFFLILGENFPHSFSQRDNNIIEDAYDFSS